MKTTTRALLAGAAMLSTSFALGQANLNFNAVSTTTKGAIRLSWNGTTNEVYEIDYADQLIDTNTGAITWQTLYADYPSHGTNTFIADAGNYDFSPEIPHPKLSPARFYRVMLVQTNDVPTNPIVTIVSPTNAASLSGDVSIQVLASSPDILSEVRLYIDGEEQWLSSDGTNFLINTCEWPNGPHTLFATAKSQSGFEGVANGGVITYGRAVSPYRNVTFDNLITRFDFSQPFFEPALGQTQAVTAAFTANVNWTLEIQDQNSNDVRYVTGTGSTMEFDWDGTGTNGVAIPDGVYSYLLTAQTNGGAFSASLSSGENLTLSSEVTSRPEELLATRADGTGPVVPFALYPPGINTNDLIIFEGSLSDYLPRRYSAARLTSSSSMESSVESPGAFGGASQSTRGPKTKPKIGNKNLAGTFGVLYRTYGTSGFTSPHPHSGFPPPLRTFVGIDGQPTTALTVDYRLLQFATVALDFAAGLKKAAWKPAFFKPDAKWDANTIKKTSLGGQQIFENCNFGMMMTHGSYANSGQTEADGVLYTYTWLGPNDYVRLSDQLFGQYTGTNHLKWMTLFACNMLRPANITSMANNSLLPIGDGLHLLLGSQTTMYLSTPMGKYYASNLVANVTIENSWYNCASLAYSQGSRGMTNTVTLRVMGQNNCFSDTLTSNQDPDPNTAFQIKSSTVFTYP